MIYKNNYVNIINYQKIIVLEDDKLILTSDKQNITIKGHNLKLLKLLNNEVLIKGEINNIELR